MAIRKFQRGQSTYTCRCCKKQTRNTSGEGSCQLCVDCYDLSGIENHLLDNGAESMVENYGKDVKNTLARRPELVPLFSEVAAAMSKNIPVEAKKPTPPQTSPKCM